MIILESQHISKSFNGLQVLKDVSFSLSKGSITSLFGENGSGKTTLYNIVSGYLKPDGGKISYNGNSLNDKSSVNIARMGIGRVWQTPRICKNLSVEDNLLLGAKDHPGEHFVNYLIHPRKILQKEKNLKRNAKDIANNVGLVGKLQKTGGNLSFGQQKLLSIGMLLMNDAKVLMLDEPFAGINAKMVNNISDVLIQLKKDDKTICLVEHNRRKAKAISDNVLFLEKGEIMQKETIPV